MSQHWQRFLKTPSSRKGSLGALEIILNVELVLYVFLYSKSFLDFYLLKLIN